MQFVHYQQEKKKKNEWFVVVDARKNNSTNTSCLIPYMDGSSDESKEHGKSTDDIAKDLWIDTILSKSNDQHNILKDGLTSLSNKIDLLAAGFFFFLCV